MDPLLIDVPERVETRRLLLRCLQPGDGAALNAAVVESLAALKPWMPWAQTAPTIDESEAHCRRQQATFRLREGMSMLMFERESQDAEAGPIGAIGFHRPDWTVRRFEIGYWCRTARLGRGFVTEAVVGLSRMAFDRLQARRVEIRMDPRNERSRKVAARAGFTLEGVLRQDSVTPQGEARDTCVYARVRGVEEAG